MKSIKILVISFLAIYGAAQAAWSPKINCNNGDVVVDSEIVYNSESNTYSPIYQLVIRDSRAVSYLSGFGNSNMLVNAKGEMLMNMSAGKGTRNPERFLSNSIFNDRATTNWVSAEFTEEKGELKVSILEHIGSGSSYTNELSNWYFNNCQYKKH